MFEQVDETLISTRYIPNIAYHDDSSSLVLIAKEEDKNQFLWETAEYYSRKDIPTVFLCSQKELTECMASYEHLDQLNDKNITFHEFSLKSLSWLIDKVRTRYRPIGIALNSLPETPDSETEDLLDFAEKMEAFHTQFILFADKPYDYIKGRVPIATLDYLLKEEEHRLMMVDFSEDAEWRKKLLISGAD